MNQMALFQLETPSMPNLDTGRCYVRLISSKTASTMIKAHHYSHRVPPIRIAFGMYVDDVLAGCITYGRPASSKTESSVCGKRFKNIVLELNRLFVHDWAGHNSESWLIGQSFKSLNAPAILISMADSGQNHIGYIYQATNWIYTGLSDDSGCFSRIEVDGKERTSKSFYEELGSQSQSVILEHYPDAIFHEYTRKHRYVYFLGNRKQRKVLRNALRWPVFDYPKSS